MTKKCTSNEHHIKLLLNEDIKIYPRSYFQGNYLCPDELVNKARTYETSESLYKFPDNAPYSA